MKSFFVCLSIFSLFLFNACSTPWMTNTKRNAIEQYLISATIERGLGAVNFMEFSKKKVCLDYSCFDPQTDKLYAQGVLESCLSSFGMIVTKKEAEADIILQPLCGVLATDHNKFLIGTPPIPIPVPYTDLTFAVPEIPLFSKFSRVAYGKFSFNIYNAKDRKPICSIKNIKSSAKYINWIILLFPYRTNDMDMKNTVDGEVSYDLNL